ncbi:hypothetical protein MYAER_2903 [Microcystis aeruginosa NIES-2549]|uniref:Uncharacterized protein n=1 Tax=Microcystis aeruginosa NIES-2549 TaxID=1641812 RepID=A0A0F6RMH6_MICAE|nr:hypothetical protein MYAER_2903 [Microcystis aeruginosa NIES-2549]AOC53650.1 hypothetical protein amyaer_2943 [Microcystis aeruginosa NIES-2481]
MTRAGLNWQFYHRPPLLLASFFDQKSGKSGFGAQNRL